MGKNAEKVLGLRWEDLWLEDIRVLRNKLGIIMGDEGTETIAFIRSV
jgi:ubiquinone biosynthesis protein Coq4